MEKSARQNVSLDSVITLSVCTIPGMRRIDVALVPDTTADDVIAFCKEELNLRDNYCLAADFDGFDKQFGLKERLFNLVKKQILVNTNDRNNVKFFLRKKKRVVEKVDTGELMTSVSKISLYQSESTSDLQSDVELSSIKDDKMAVNNSCIPSHFSNMSYSDLLQLAERQKRQIESNNIVITHKETRLKSLRQQMQSHSNNDGTLERLQKLRHQVQSEEAQLQRMRRLKLDSEEEAKRNQNAQTELHEARRLFAEKERQLKEASDRVEEMSRRLDLLRRRRMLIAKESELKRLDEKFDALAVKVKKPTADNSLSLPSNQTKLSAGISPLPSSASSAFQKRPKAAIEPFKVTPPQGELTSTKYGVDISSSVENNSVNNLNNSYMASKGFVTVFNAVEEALQRSELDSSSDSSSKTTSISINKSINDRSINTYNRQNNYYSNKNQHSVVPNLDASLLLNGYGSSLSSFPAKSQDEIDGSSNNNNGRSKVNVSMNRRFQWTSSFDTEAPPPDLIPANEKSKYGTVAAAQPPTSSSPSSGSENGVVAMAPTDPDKIALRNDTLRAAKRRSWAEHHGGGFTNDEAEHIRMLLCREQQKGKSSVNLSWIFGQLANNGAGQLAHAEPRPSGIVKLATSSVEDGFGVKTDFAVVPNVVASSKSPSPPPEVLPDEHQYEMRQLNDEETPPNLSTEDDERSSITIIEVVPELLDSPSSKASNALSVKSILRPANKESSGRRIRFDPLALLLDSALEGELELVKRLSGQIKNVSECNDEGITALHNAICAGHYEIVRFLVEADADVNSQDSDGWTPLHCAASCNNLPMVKFLVERGACVFATTLSDHETPADKCEEDEDGFDGCSQFLLTIQEKLGVLNNGRVYGAYEFDAKYEDEFDFKIGDEMVVLSKSDKEKGWWWAKHSPTGAEGFVPRNYLALYPRLSIQRTLAMACEIETSKLMASSVEANAGDAKLDEAMEVNPSPAV